MELPFKKIRHQTLAVVITTALLPLLLLALFVAGRLRTELTFQALQTQKDVAEAVRQGIQLQIDAWILQLEHLAESPNIQGMDAASQTSVLFRFLDQSALFASAFIYAPDGTINAVAYRNRYMGDNRLVGENLLSSKANGIAPMIAAFKDVVETKKRRVSERISKASQKERLIVLLPIKAFDDPKRLVGVLSVALQLDGVVLQEMIEGVSNGRPGFLLLSDRQGNIIAKKGRDLPPGLEKMTLSRRPDAGFESIWSTLENHEYLVTVGPVSAINGTIVVAAPKEAVLGFIGRILGGMGLLTLISLFTAGAFGLVLARSLLEPTQRLLEGIQKVAEGNVAHRIDVPETAEDELSEAGRAFNDMAGRLEQDRLIEDIWDKTWKPPS